MSNTTFSGVRSTHGPTSRSESGSRDASISITRECCARSRTSSGATTAPIWILGLTFLRVLPDERIIWVSISTSRVPQTPERSAHLIMHIEDVSDRKRLEAELNHRALHDPLTGLANRALLAERMREVLARRGRHSRVGHLFYLDLDGFKTVNDRFGHAAGDAVLTQLAQRIVALLRTGDVAARLGGDEFAVLCDDTEPQHAVSIAERLRMAAAEPFVVDGSTIKLSAAVGCCATDHTDPAALLREADRRMYEGKRRRARPVPVPVPVPAARRSS